MSVDQHQFLQSLCISHHRKDDKTLLNTSLKVQNLFLKGGGTPSTNTGLLFTVNG